MGAVGRLICSQQTIGSASAQGYLDNNSLEWGIVPTTKNIVSSKGCSQARLAIDDGHFSNWNPGKWLAAVLFSSELIDFTVSARGCSWSAAMKAGIGKSLGSHWRNLWQGVG